MSTVPTEIQNSILALYRQVTGEEAELDADYSLEQCLADIGHAVAAAEDAREQEKRVQQTEARIIRRMMDKLLEGEISEARAGVIRSCLEQAKDECNRILEQAPLKLGLPGEEGDEGDASAQLIDVIISAVTDPGLYDEFQGERSLSEWQQDAVLAALDETGFDLVHDYDEFTDSDLDTLKAELNIANTMIEKLYQRVYEKLE